MLASFFLFVSNSPCLVVTVYGVLMANILGWFAVPFSREEEDDRGWAGWMAALTRWTWTWADSRRWWGTGRPAVLRAVGSGRARRELMAEQKPPVPRLCAVLFFLVFFAFVGRNELGAVFWIWDSLFFPTEHLMSLFLFLLEHSTPWPAPLPSLFYGTFIFCSL